MFILLFICWILFNQAFTIEIMIFGLLISALIFVFMCRFMDYSVKKDLFILKKLPGIILYVFILLFEIIKANFVIFKLFATKGDDREPVIVSFRTGIKTRIGRTLLANSITLTPGTITVKLEGNLLTVHCYDKSLAVGLNDTVFERKIKKLEEGA